ncbi:hypothetical protein, partial [Treponema saccharophilum]|uniref:hypothetical protein n=1 Tax=Treponema saccharophilum TaxID=165 RepID=UPI003870B5B7
RNYCPSVLLLKRCAAHKNDLAEKLNAPGIPVFPAFFAVFVGDALQNGCSGNRLCLIPVLLPN